MTVLRPVLYAQLQRAFQTVKIANQGLNIKWSMKTELWRDGQMHTVRWLDKNAGDNWGESYRVNCPYCVDHKQRLYISHMWGLLDVLTGSRNLWLAHCQNENCIDTSEMRQTLYSAVWGALGPISTSDVVVAGRELPPLAEGEVENPGSVWPLDRLPPDHPAVTYLYERRYNAMWLAQNLGIGYIWEPPLYKPVLRDRIFIPVYLGGVLVGWQARSVRSPRDGEAKYMFSRAFPRSRALYNYDFARAYSCVTVVEGSTKVWRFGPDSVATFGKSVTGLQLSLLLATWKEIVFLLDTDAKKQSLELPGRMGDAVKFWVVLLKEGQAVDDMATAEVRAISQAARAFPSGSVIEAASLGV